MGEIEKKQTQEVIPVEEVRELIAGAVRDGIAEGVGRALEPLGQQLGELARQVGRSNEAVASRLQTLADEMGGRETNWDEHDANAHRLDPGLGQRQKKSFLG